MKFDRNESLVFPVFYGKFNWRFWVCGWVGGGGRVGSRKSVGHKKICVDSKKDLRLHPLRGFGEDEASSTENPPGES